MDLSILAAPILIISGLPQTIKLLKTKNSENISKITYFLTWLGIGLILTEAEGFVFVANLTSWAMVTINLTLINII